MNQITIRVYGPLNDFLPPARRQRDQACAFEGRASVKDVIERLGVPHPEIDLVLVNGIPVGFEQPIRDGDRIAAFPPFADLDVSGVTAVRADPLVTARFILDGHLGALARHLRLMGLDATYAADARDEELAAASAAEGRILLTRDVGLLKRRLVTRGYFVRGTKPRAQLLEVLRRYRSATLAPFSRCLACNTPLRPVPKPEVEDRLAPRTRQDFDEFQACQGCGRLYWKGSHWSRLAGFVGALVDELGRAGV
jgi:uncharacterized protein